MKLERKFEKKNLLKTTKASLMWGYTPCGLHSVGQNSSESPINIIWYPNSSESNFTPNLTFVDWKEIVA